MIDHASYTPVYRQLAEILRQRIASGDLAPGEALPSETQLMQEFGIARITVREAMKALRAEGLVITARRRGSYVRGEGERVPVIVQGTVDVSARMPTPQERQELGIPEGVPLLVVEREGQEPELLPADRVVVRMSEGT
ncbi:GntR family transcriptional regulator [Streptosporangium sp. NPDC000239]|uniref:GntR family transcriptional regulator n=1 Tax=Streptosporangium sp. NPDC000239 TaxID=3154248 RepID=UPI00332D0F5F